MSKHVSSTLPQTHATPALPNGFNLNGKWEAAGLVGPVISSNGVSISVDMSAYGRPTAHGSFISSTEITVTFPDDNTYTGQLVSASYTIQWSNNTSWQLVVAVVPDVRGYASDTPGNRKNPIFGADILKAAGFVPVFQQLTEGPIIVGQNPLNWAAPGSKIGLQRGVDPR